MKTSNFNIFSIVFLMTVSLAIGQQTDHSVSLLNNTFLQTEERSGKLFFSVGIEHKIALITNRQDDNPLGINVGDQNSGPALFYNLEYYLNSRWSLSFEHSLRYGHLIGPSIDGLVDGGISAEQFGWFMDYHGGVSYAFYRPRPDRAFYGSLGVSFINRGKTAGYQRPFDGLAQSSEITDPFIYTYRLGLGYRSKRTHYSVNFYPIGTNHTYPLMSLYIGSFKIRYTLGKL